MKAEKKTLIGSLIALVLGTSCCWVSSLVIWLGGATLVGGLAHLVEKSQVVFILIGCFLGIISLYLYFRNRKSELEG